LAVAAIALGPRTFLSTQALENLPAALAEYIVGVYMEENRKRAMRGLSPA
jgi:hypothetical protein